MPVQFITHKGKKILHADYTSCNDQQEILEVLDQTANILKNHPGEALVLVDFSDQFGSRAYMNRVKELESTYGHNVKKRALLGVNGMKKVLLMGFNKFNNKESKTVPFGKKEAALDYLVE